MTAPYYWDKTNNRFPVQSGSPVLIDQTTFESCCCSSTCSCGSCDFDEDAEVDVVYKWWQCEWYPDVGIEFDCTGSNPDAILGTKYVATGLTMADPDSSCGVFTGTASYYDRTKTGACGEPSWSGAADGTCDITATYDCDDEEWTISIDRAGWNSGVVYTTLAAITACGGGSASDDECWLDEPGGPGMGFAAYHDFESLSITVGPLP